MIATFARADHPRGYGQPEGKAHGYVVLHVRCNSRKQLAAVIKRLNDWRKPFYGIEGQTYDKGNLREWYGGRFDILSVIPGNKIEIGIDLRSAKVWDAYRRFHSLGDNRFVGVFEAAEVLAN